MTYQFENSFENETSNHKYLNEIAFKICQHLFNIELIHSGSNSKVFNSRFKITTDSVGFRVIIDYPIEKLILSFGFNYTPDNIVCLENCHVIGIPKMLASKLKTSFFCDELPTSIVVDFDCNHEIDATTISYSVKVHHAHINNFHWEDVVYLSQWTEFEFIFKLQNNITDFLLIYNQSERNQKPQNDTFSINNMNQIQFHYVFGLFKILENINEKNIINELFPYLTVYNVSTLETFKDVFNKYLYNEDYNVLVDKFTLLEMTEI